MPKFDESMEGMLDTFLFETGELLENLDEILMRAEQAEDISLIEESDIAEIFRTMHTIKGSAAMMGLQNMSALAHAMEDMFYIIREKTYVQTDKSALFDLLYKSSDALKGELEDLTDEDKPLTDFSGLINDIHVLAAYFKGEAEKSGQEDNALPADIFDENEPPDMLTYRLTYSDSCEMPSARAIVLFRKLGAVAEVCRTIPPDMDDDGADGKIKAAGLFIKLVTDDRAAVERVLAAGMNVENFELFTPEMLKAQTSAAPAKQELVIPDGVFLPDDPDSLLTYRVMYSESCAMPSARAMVLLRKLGAFAEVCRTVPADLDADSADDEIAKNGLYIKLITDDTNAVERLLDSGINVESALPVKKPAVPQKPAEPAPQEEKQEVGQAEKKPAEPKKTAAKAPKKEQSLLTVKLEKLDRLLDLVSEIVITESAVTSSPDLRGLETRLDRFNKSSRELKKLTDELQDVVMSLRMVPVSTAFQKMNRVVRDMNNTLKKNATLVFRGEDTEVDKSIVDMLGDPLMHIVRNAVDHGIETPEERLAAGKTNPPTVTLSAGYESNEVVISCKDNGAGMDAAKILAKAKKNGMLTKPESEYTEKEIFNFVVAAGFSTNEQVTQYSGRGVGMDVVKQNIEKVGGKLIVNSVLGKGSSFTIRIPLSLSILDVLSVEVGASSISIPASSIREAFSCKAESLITDPDGNEFVYLRDRCFPLIRLGEKLQIDTDITEPADGICMYCREGQYEAVLLADRIVCDQQVVVKPFSPLLDGLHLKEAGLAGCSILGDGSMTIILDMLSLLGGELGEEAQNG
ncbi:ATP-binding protein [Ruminococcus albus]|uniref:Chemotaxis protein CheA n=1 Tax=Ruminococcus albus 8 TaxID=246199 RepID=E9S9G7_RUMAL|nr:ATP-binding protein [Ruminococcus albus]EGC04099.1 putative chemotaxis protein CheA [Ruminococcus albus 8]MCC3350682.1 Hpt domain-containing protein [Ruminococcus albus 8]